uniref:Uncharacterized protein n=1 Tax=Arundo donax TaxID=35708 RepID=A0A0A9AAG3_ARUDO
MYFLLLIQE